MEGVRVSKRERSGVIVREAGPCCGRIAAIEFKFPDELCVVGGGVDQENDGVGALWSETFRAGCAVAFGASHGESMGFDDPPLPILPFTRLSKSISPLSPPLLDANAFGAPNDMKSSLACACEPFEPESSCSFLDCSDSTRPDKLLMSSMND